MGGSLLVVQMVWASSEVVLTPVEQLGKELFFDRISQPARSQSCAACHLPDAGWTGGVAGINLHGSVYRGADRHRFGNRKPPSSAYATFSPVFDLVNGRFVGGNFWDGRATGERLGNPAADQALGPFLNPVEQNNPTTEAVCRQVAKSKYAALFEQVWGVGSLDCSSSGIEITYDRIGLSIAAYEGSREVSPFSSKFDAYLMACLDSGIDLAACGRPAEGALDRTGILTDKEFRGLIKFGKHCSGCHVSHLPGPGGEPPLFTSFGFANVGTPRNPENPFYRMDRVFLDDGTPINPLGQDYVDFGLGDFLRTRPEWADLASANDGKFKIPTVRNVDRRPGTGFPKAYLHNGAITTLKEVVHFYNTRDVPSENWPPPEVPQNVTRGNFGGVPLGDLQLDLEDEDAIVAFLKTLSDGFLD
jgi:cytochrome c peroxidase